jgi:DNA modification methylase
MIKHFQTDLITLYNGDCIETMESLIKNGIKVNKVITSPPYHITRPNSSDRGYDVYKDRILTNDQYIQWTLKIFNSYDSILNKDGCILYNMSYGTENTEIMNLTVAEIIKNTNFTLADILVWKKKSATPNNVSSNKMTRIVEFVYVFARKNDFYTFTSNKKVIDKRETNQNIYENVFNFFEADNNDESNDLNKATFSTEFVESLIERYVLKTDVVLDNFSGTGTTIKTCESLGIKAIGIELSEAQCNYTKERFSKGIQISLL